MAGGGSQSRELLLRRALSLVQLLEGGKTVALKEWAREQGITRRQANRWIRALEDIGYPLYCPDKSDPVGGPSGLYKKVE